MPSTFFSDISNDHEIHSRLPLIDKSVVLRAGIAIADSLNEAERLAAYERRLSDLKRKNGALPFAVELNYLKALRRFNTDVLTRGTSGARAIVEQIEVSGLNPILSRHFQNSVVNGKFPIGEQAQQAKKALESGTLNLLPLSEVFGLNAEITQQIPGMLGFDPARLLTVDVIMPADLERLKWLAGMGINQQGQNLGVDGTVGGGGAGPSIVITKGVDLVLTDLIFTTEIEATATFMQSLIAGVPSMSRIPRRHEEGERVAHSLQSSAQAGVIIGCLLVGLGILAGSPALSAVGLLLAIGAWLVGTLLGFVDP